MTKTEFIKMYISAFLGSLAAHQYRDARPGWQTEIVNPPIEYGMFQAEESWKRCVESKPTYFVETDDVQEDATES